MNIDELVTLILVHWVSIDNFSSGDLSNKTENKVIYDILIILTDYCLKREITRIIFL